jgi:hypothetical protein
MTSDPTERPESWTIAQVREWAESKFPFGTALAAALVENDVDGAVLLEYISNETLKQDLGIKSLGQRVKILQAINELNSKQGNS